MTLRIVLGLVTGLALTWLALALALLVVKPKGGLLKEALSYSRTSSGCSSASRPTGPCHAA